jgi:rhomboid protease GluP
MSLSSPSDPRKASPSPIRYGFPPVEPPVHPDLLFISDVRSRAIPFTYALLAINLVIFVLMELSGGSMNEATLIAFGVKSNAAIDQGEIWRFITPVFIHIGVLHLVLNSYALWIVGQQVERFYGSARFITLYVLMGISGVAGSYLYSPNALSAGASGAIFGLFGVLLVFGIRHKHNVPPFLSRAIRSGILPVIGINLVIGFLIPVIDNAAHIGGLLAGMTLAAVVGFASPGSRTPAVFHVARVAAIASVFLSFYQVGVRYDGPGLRISNLARSWSPLFGGQTTTEQFIQAVNATQQSFGATRRAIRDGDAMAENEGLSSTLGNSIDLLRDLPSLSGASDPLVEDLKDTAEQLYVLIEDIGRSGRLSTDHTRRLEESLSRYQTVFGRLMDWIDTEGERYGLQRGDRE